VEALEEELDGELPEQLLSEELQNVANRFHETLCYYTLDFGRSLPLPQGPSHLVSLPVTQPPLSQPAPLAQPEPLFQPLSEPLSDILSLPVSDLLSLPLTELLSEEGLLGGNNEEKGDSSPGALTGVENRDSKGNTTRAALLAQGAPPSCIGDTWDSHSTRLLLALQAFLIRAGVVGAQSDEDREGEEDGAGAGAVAGVGAGAGAGVATDPAGVSVQLTAQLELQALSACKLLYTAELRPLGDMHWGKWWGARDNAELSSRMMDVVVAAEQAMYLEEEEEEEASASSYIENVKAITELIELAAVQCKYKYITNI